MFSIVVPLYNKEKSVPRAIESVLEQSYTNFELIIVNDGSTDDSLNVVGNIKDERIKIINKKNGGVSSARNVGIENANSEWICFLDADDYWKQNHLEVIAELQSKYKEGKLYSTLVCENSEKGIEFIENSLTDNYEGYIDNYFSLASKGTIFHSSSVCVSKKALLEIGSFDPNLKHGEDLDVWFKLMMKNKAVIRKVGTAVYDLLGENRAMHLKCSYEKHLLSKIDNYRSDKVPYLNEFIDYYILRNSIPYYFSEDKNKVYPALLNVKIKKETQLIWKFIYSKKNFQINYILYRFYKRLRLVF
ncbi:glycosyltransferase family A protein [Flavobacterium sp.]|uniref:glycosyltransferase family 2 protein n=1 Tax=Flavobacterium sp. TaxID=239 RepID=UPI0031DF47DD